MRRRHSSHNQRTTRSGSVSQGRAILRAAQRAKRLDGRWSGGYFAPGVGVVPTLSRKLLKHLQRQPALAVLDLSYNAIEDLWSHLDSGQHWPEHINNLQPNRGDLYQLRARSETFFISR